MGEANNKPKKALNAYFKYKNEWLEADTKKNPTTDFKDRTARYKKTELRDTIRHGSQLMQRKRKILKLSIIKN